MGMMVVPASRLDPVVELSPAVGKKRCAVNKPTEAVALPAPPLAAVQMMVARALRLEPEVEMPARLE
jgi:hypothetical protein